MLTYHQGWEEIIKQTRNNIQPSLASLLDGSITHFALIGKQNLQIVGHELLSQMSHCLIDSKITDLYVINFSEFMISKNVLQKMLWNVPLKVHIYSQNINEKFKVQANKFDFDKGVYGHVE